MIISFGDEATRDIFDGCSTKLARKSLKTNLFITARRKLDMINAAIGLDDLRIPPANRLEVLKGNYKGFYSIRINNQYRVVFRWSINGAEEVKITDYH